MLPPSLLVPVALFCLHAIAASGAPRRVHEGLPRLGFGLAYGAEAALAIASAPITAGPFICFQFWRRWRLVVDHRARGRV